MTPADELNEVSVFAPATVANVSCGFDVMGFALKQPGDQVVARRNNERGLKITKITGDDGALPLSPEQNTAGIAAKSVLRQLDYDGGVSLEIHKKMPMGSGLGSSAASAVGAAIAVNRLLGNPFKPEELLHHAASGEKVASGTIHYDNAAPSLLGGLVFIRSQDPLDVIEIECPVPLFATVVHPHIEIQTGNTRKILSRDVPLKNAVTQWGNVGGLIAGLLKGDYELISNSLEDVIIEPIRGILIPGFQQVKDAALAAGALGSGISGSGPSIFALSSTLETARITSQKMKQAFDELGLNNDVYVSPVKTNGPRILNEE